MQKISFTSWRRFCINEQQQRLNLVKPRMTTPNQFRRFFLRAWFIQLRWKHFCFFSAERKTLSWLRWLIVMTRLGMIGKRSLARQTLVSFTKMSDDEGVMRGEGVCGKTRRKKWKLRFGVTISFLRRRWKINHAILAKEHSIARLFSISLYAITLD